MRNMRTPLLAGLIAVLLPACTDGITDVGGGGDDTGGGASCGNAAIESGETCDDGNTTSGDGCSATCATESSSPRVTVTVDKPTLSTELMTTNKLTLTVTGSGGFAGDVTLAATAVDGSNAPLAAWTVSLDKPTVTLTANGTATAVATLTIPSENKGLTGAVKIDATSSADPASVMSAVTAANQVTFAVTQIGAQCAYPTTQPTNVTYGTKIRFLNNTTDLTTIIHVNGVALVNGQLQGTGIDETNTFGVPHENQGGPGEMAGAAYEGVLTQKTTTSQGLSWYCHSPGPSRNALLIKPVAATN
jgi:cysteine-rich repeat protein